MLGSTVSTKRSFRAHRRRDMSGESLSKAGRGVTATGYAVLTAVSLLAVAAVCIVGARPVQALPSYARQTGQECAACHNGFPELTPYGRQFKLNGYTWTGGPSNLPTWTGGSSNLPPIAAMAIPTFTNVRKGVDGGLVPGFGYNNDFAFAGSLFYGGKIFDGLGTFAQVTYDNVPNRIHWDKHRPPLCHTVRAVRQRGGLRCKRQQQPDRERRLELDAGLGLPLSRFGAGAESGCYDVDRGYFRATGGRPQPVHILEPAGLCRGRRIWHIVAEDQHHARYRTCGDQCLSGNRPLLAARHRTGVGTEHLGIRHLRVGDQFDTREDYRQRHRSPDGYRRRYAVSVPGRARQLLGAGPLHHREPEFGSEPSARPLHQLAQ